MNIEDRVEKLSENKAYITIKDHKENFTNKTPCRLINPSKTEIGKISKQLLDRINKDLLLATQVNQWKNTASVLDWFNKIKRKDQCLFLLFDIESFYPSISSKLFNDALEYAKLFTTISIDEVAIIKQSRKTLLLWNDDIWIKKEGDENFDVPMGCFDVAEISELVGIYLQNKLSNIMNKKDFGLYRDDGLDILRNTSGPEAERKRKRIIKIFKECGLTIKSEANLKIVDFLDVRLIIYQIILTNLSVNQIMTL